MSVAISSLGALSSSSSSLWLSLALLDAAAPRPGSLGTATRGASSAAREGAAEAEGAADGGATHLLVLDRLASRETAELEETPPRAPGVPVLAATKSPASREEPVAASPALVEEATDQAEGATESTHLDALACRSLALVSLRDALLPCRARGAWLRDAADAAPRRARKRAYARGPSAGAGAGARGAVAAGAARARRRKAAARVFIGARASMSDVFSNSVRVEQGIGRGDRRGARSVPGRDGIRLAAAHAQGPWGRVGRGPRRRPSRGARERKLSPGRRSAGPRPSSHRPVKLFHSSATPRGPPLFASLLASCGKRRRCDRALRVVAALVAAPPWHWSPPLRRRRGGQVGHAMVCPFLTKIGPQMNKRVL